MPKIFIQLTLSTVTSEGENQVLQAPIEVPEVKSGTPSQLVSNQIAAIMGDEKKTFSFPVQGGHVTVRGSSIEWFQVFDVPEDTPQTTDVRIGEIPVDEPSKAVPISQGKKKRK